MEVIAQIRLGRLPTHACQQVGGITWSMMRKLVDRDPEIADLFFEAMEECRDNMAEILVRIDTKSSLDVYGSTDPKMAKVISDNIKWLLERYWPEKFGTKIKVETGRADDVILAALDAAKAAISRLPAPLPGDTAKMIEGEVLRLDDLI